MKKVFLFIVIGFLTKGLTAQVTIGVNEAPIAGALLQLKMEANVSLGNVNSTKGLGMPRVKLSKRYNLTDILDNPSGSDNEDHIGLVVYQTNTQSDPIDGTFCPGLYVWTGDEWVELFDIEALDKTRYDSTSQILYDSEGNDYKTADFGIAGRWMTQNLRTKLGYPCVPIGLSGGAEGELEKPLYYYPGGTRSPGVAEPPATWTKEQGLLYNWAAATMKKGGSDGKGQAMDESEGHKTTNPIVSNIEEVGGRGLCPKGWHLPSDKEWNQLLAVIAHNRDNRYSDACMITEVETWNTDWNVVKGWQGAFSGIHMKSKTAVSSSYPSNGKSRARIDNGFDILLVGNAERAYHNLYGRYAYFWTSSAYNETDAWHRYFYHIEDKNGDGKSVYRSPTGRHYLLSIRCKQD